MFVYMYIIKKYIIICMHVYIYIYDTSLYNTPTPSFPPSYPTPLHPKKLKQMIALRVLTATLKGATFHSPQPPQPSQASSPTLLLGSAFPSLSEARAYFPQYIFPELHRLATDPQVGA